MNLLLFKTCKKCGQIKPFTDFFKNHRYKSGRLNVCKGCSQLYHSRPDVKEKHAKFEQNRRKRLGEKYLEKERERNKTRKEQRTTYNHAYYKQNAEHLKKHNAEYYNSHPDITRAIKQRRRARVAGLPSTLTNNEWQAILDKWNHACSYCGKSGVKLFRDHDVPIARGGGTTADNIRPACGSCNSRKHTMTAAEFIEKLRSKP